jgi:hypothetical protein
MLHRSPSQCALSLAAALTVSLVAAAPAVAQDKPVNVPANAPVVAGPTESGVKLVAFLHDGDLCTAILPATTGPAGLDGEPSCDTVPTLTPFGHVDLGGSGSVPTHRWLTPVIVGTDTAAVELRLAGRTVARDETIASPLPGATADLRFALLETANPVPADELALLDGSGAVRRAYDLERLGGFVATVDEGSPPKGAVVLRGHRGDVRWTLRVGLQSFLASTPLEPERRTTQPCLNLSTTRPDGSAFAGGTCDREGASEPIVFDVGVDCAPMGPHIAVLARAAVGRVVVVLGDGRRLPIPLRAVPGAAAGMRAGAVVLGTGVAARRIMALGRSGTVLTTSNLGLEPTAAGRDCLGSASALTYSLDTSAPALPGAGPHALVATDHGPAICLAVDLVPRIPDDCGSAPIDVEDVFLRSRATAGGRFVFGLVPLDVATARLTLDDGAVRDVPAVPIPGYLGQYATVLRVIAADVPGIHRVVGYRLMDPRGRTVQNIAFGPERPALRHVTTLRRLPGVPELRAAVRPGVAGRPATACIALGPPRDGNACTDVTPSHEFVVVARCTPRQILVYGLLRRAADRLVIRTASGREIAARRLALPATVRRAGRVAAVAVAVLGPRNAPRRLVRRGAKPSQVPFVLPAAGRQCGYTSWASLPFGGG